MNARDYESNGYVATPVDIQEITQGALDASALSQNSRMTYLKVLVGTTQSELGIQQTKRRTVPAPMTPDDTKKQLEALESVHERFYEAVMKVVQSTPLLEEERGRDRRLVYAARANFARSAKSTLRSWLLSENNIRSLVAGKVTKYGLQAEIQKRRSPAQARAPSEKRLVTAADRLLERIRHAGSPEDSIRLLEAVIGRLVAGLGELGVETTTRLEDAVRDHKLVQTRAGVFWPAPVQTQEAAAA